MNGYFRLKAAFRCDTTDGFVALLQEGADMFETHIADLLQNAVTKLFTETQQKPFTITVALKNIHLPITAQRHIIDCTGIFNSQFSSHDLTWTKRKITVNHYFLF